MERQVIYVTDNDARRLEELIGNPSALEDRSSDCLARLRDELARAEIVHQKDIPPDVVTMNSTVHLIDTKTGEKEAFTLVFPSDADIEQGRISVLAPVGTAILGYKAGDTFVWSVPGGERHLRIEAVTYQPEASGDYHL